MSHKELFFPDNKFCKRNLIFNCVSLKIIATVFYIILSYSPFSMWHSKQWPQFCCCIWKYIYTDVFFGIHQMYSFLSWVFSSLLVLNSLEKALRNHSNEIYAKSTASFKLIAFSENKRSLFCFLLIDGKQPIMRRFCF